MKYFLKITIQPLPLEKSDILMAELAEEKFYAFENEEHKLIGYILENDFDAALFDRILPLGVRYEIERIADKDWNEEWEKGMKPVVFDRFLTIRPAFHPSVKGVKYDIVITPKMSFGTGHHGTTSLMIKLMRELDLAGKSVVDFGTGTGVLAILAQMMGAREVTAIDNDEWSIRNAAENIALNDCNRIDIIQAQSFEGFPPADMVLANINLNVLLDNTHWLVKGVNPSGYLLLSGVLVQDKKTIIDAFETAELHLVKGMEEDGWLGFLFRQGE